MLVIDKGPLKDDEKDFIVQWVKENRESNGTISYVTLSHDLKGESDNGEGSHFDEEKNRIYVFSLTFGKPFEKSSSFGNSPISPRPSPLYPPVIHLVKILKLTYT
ncbi:2445_t:CDS:2 [Funneliformis geosporum]|uniref:13009_t:CDS:1 n=1 Tax=Funneliformis geosporum TaxID=1117311 RepID=A0A9W4SGQ9_9GLOM|nr:13009_t:CDS:2 [Funneliformis geosporum]CAI2176261.1 2445_t:CDS:2 [Funneliformis geosporum]